ncbi:hypothetical protein MTR67_001249 [Solanum verrucosum]|uniref:NB-ARC domain-containing protein n=1 Tax=Solanum verrucosum TaxID=315347 RepID=A0AAF0PTY0_SOLVR|nr:hypothetical protein MTR67_001249 [Solanum verrucosum]
MVLQILCDDVLKSEEIRVEIDSGEKSMEQEATELYKEKVAKVLFGRDGVGKSCIKVLEKKIGRLGLKEHFVSIKQETKTSSTCLVDESDIFGRQSEIEDFIDRSEDASGKKLTIVPMVGLGGLGKTALAKAVYHDEKVKNHFGLKAWYCVSEPYDALRITKGLLQENGSFDSKDVHNNLNQLQVKLKEA